MLTISAISLGKYKFAKACINIKNIDITSKRVNGFKNLKGINNTVKKIEESGGTAIGFKADVSNIVEVKIMVEEIIKKFGIIDILVNNSGISQEGIESIDNVINLEEKDWDKVVNINLKGIFLTSKFVLPHMVRQKSGTIINISSILGALAGPNLAAYCASKGGMLTLTKEMAWDYGKYNIRVNCISPGYVETDIFNFTLSQSENPAELRRHIESLSALNKVGKPEEIANAILFLASDDSSFITGTNILVDGGYSAK